MAKLNLLHFADGDMKWYNHSVKQLGSFFNPEKWKYNSILNVCIFTFALFVAIAVMRICSCPRSLCIYTWQHLLRVNTEYKLKRKEEKR